MYLTRQMASLTVRYESDSVSDGMYLNVSDGIWSVRCPSLTARRVSDCVSGGMCLNVS